MNVFSWIILTIHRAFTSLSHQIAFGMFFGGLGAFILTHPNTEVLQIIASRGISPIGYGLSLIICGAFILITRGRVFAILTLPYLVYCVAYIQFVHDSAPEYTASAFVHFAVWVISQRVAAEPEMNVRNE